MNENFIRRMLEEAEEKELSRFAVKSSKSKGRKKEEPECPIRTCFQRDRDRIIHSKAFRRLKHKTQVFIAPIGDHYRTRLTHTLEVYQIATTIGRALRLNIPLIEAISLGHDLGHTPFGHAGEEVLNELSSFGFKHYEQSVRVVEFLETASDGTRGLNLTYETIMGIYYHSKGTGDIFVNQDENEVSLEAIVVRISDIIAYLNHDIDDAMRAGILKLKDIPCGIIDVLGETHSKRIGTIVRNVVENSYDKPTIKISQNILDAINELKDFMYKNVYLTGDHLQETNKAKRLLKDIFEFLKENPEYLEKEIKNKITGSEDFERILVDFVAGMTDNYAIEFYKKIFIPEPLW